MGYTIRDDAPWTDAPPFHDSGKGLRTDLRIYAYPDGHLHLYLKGASDFPDLTFHPSDLKDASETIGAWLGQLVREAKAKGEEAEDNENQSLTYRVTSHNDGSYSIWLSDGRHVGADDDEELIQALKQLSGLMPEESEAPLTGS